jgi:rubrerythrin
MVTPAARAVLEDMAIEEGRHEAFLRAWQVEWGFDVDVNVIDAFAVAYADAYADAYAFADAVAAAYADAAADADAYPDAYEVDTHTVYEENQQ